MATRLPALRQPPIGFAHRGARARAPENTIEAFQLALRLGATGLESDVWFTADHQAVLDHDGVVGGRLRKAAIATLDRATLPGHIPTLAELYAACGHGFELSLDVKDPAAVAEVIATARDQGPECEARLWLCHPDLDTVLGFRELSDQVRLVHSTRIKQLDTLPERHAARLQELGVDAVNYHHTEWTGGLIALYHRFGILAFGWDTQFERTIGALVDAGADGVYSDHTDRMVSQITAFYPDT